MYRKILIGTNALPPQVGGLENFTHDLALQLHQMGHLVTVLASSDYGMPQPNRIYETVTLDSFMIKRLPIPKLTQKNVAFYSLCRKENFDLVILQSHLFISNWIAALVLKRKAKLVWINYGGGSVKNKSMFVNKLIQLYESIGWKIFEFCSDVRLAQSEKSALRMKLGHNPASIVNNCIPESLSDLELRRGEINKICKILFVGRLVEDKRPLELLEQVRNALGKLEVKHSAHVEEVTLTLIGNGPLRDKIIEFLDSEFRISWVVKELPDRNSVLKEMLKHDLLLQFPITEGQPGVTLEAINIGLPILTTPIDNCLEELDGVFVCESIDYAYNLLNLMINIRNFEVNVIKNRTHLRNHHSIHETSRKILES
jgi:glycosyltransferase involved in cell wall biosynthesis